MTRLTEEMVIARSKQSDLGSIKKLNCWGSELSDVSIVKRMRGVEVLALSVNKISTLQPFEECMKLQELYLRKNNIQDINEIAYLQNLPALKFLWLEENPCCDRAGSNYRGIVLRTLPNLKKLDNVEVTQEEIDNALRDPRGGDSLAAEQDTYEDAYEQKQQQYEPHQQQQSYQQQPQQQQPQYQQPQQRQQQQYQSQQQQQQQYHSQPRNSTSPQKEPLLQSSSENTEESTSEPLNAISKPSSPTQRSPGSDQGSPHAGYRDRASIPSTISTHSMKEYYQSDRPAYPAHYRHSQSDLTEWEEHPHTNQGGSMSALHHGPRRGAERDERYGYRNGNARENGDWEDTERPKIRGRFGESSSTVSSAVLNHYGYHRRPINRSSNLLSATLCLVKELDYPSLEVVEHAVRCRIDELAAE